jgi:hypothetical protein
MTKLWVVLAIFTVAIFAVSILAVLDGGVNWPAVFVSDLLAFNWRSQFNTDLLLHLILLGVWVTWREGGGALGWLWGFFCVFWGGMFTFPYLIYAGYQARGDARMFLLGIHTSPPTSSN